MRFFITPSCRRLISASLLLCVGALGLMPRVMVGQALATVAENRQETHHCCCGTEDGRCCGMACCNTTPNSQEKQSPDIPRGSEDRSQPIGLPESNCLALAAVEVLRARGYLAEHFASLSGASLVKLGIQLNV